MCALLQGVPAPVLGVQSRPDVPVPGRRFERFTLVEFLQEDTEASQEPKHALRPECEARLSAAAFAPSSQERADFSENRSEQWLFPAQLPGADGGALRQERDVVGR